MGRGLSMIGGGLYVAALFLPCVEVMGYSLEVCVGFGALVGSFLFGIVGGNLLHWPLFFLNPVFGVGLYLVYQRKTDQLLIPGLMVFYSLYALSIPSLFGSDVQKVFIGYYLWVAAIVCVAAASLINIIEMDKK